MFDEKEKPAISGMPEGMIMMIMSCHLAFTITFIIMELSSSLLASTSDNGDTISIVSVSVSCPPLVEVYS